MYVSPIMVAVRPFTVMATSGVTPNILPVTVVAAAFIVLPSTGDVMKRYTGGGVTVRVVFPVTD